MRAHRRQPTRLPRPWDSPGKNTGVGCHFLLQCMKVKSESESCSVVSDSSRPHGIQPTRLLRPWDFPGKSTRVGCHCLLLDLGSNPHLLQWKHRVLTTRPLGKSQHLICWNPASSQSIVHFQLMASERITPELKLTIHIPSEYLNLYLSKLSQIKHNI